MTSPLLEASGPRDAARDFSWDQLWALFDGDDEHLNIAYECLDRHQPSEVAARVAYADGRVEESTFGELSCSTSAFAHLLVEMGVDVGDRVGVMMEPSPAFYAALFGIIKRGAVAVPLYTMFGPDAVRDRLNDCAACLLVVDDSVAPPILELDYDCRNFHRLAPRLAEMPTAYAPTTAARDLAVLQYTSGTTRQLAEAVPHDHRSIVTLARAGVFALGLSAGDRYFCPSSPAWGHGLWHGTIAPWSLGIAAGSYSGRFAIARLIDSLVSLRVSNLAAASTVYRMLTETGRAGELDTLRKASYTGEELSVSAQKAFAAATGVPVCGMYGTTETGVILANYPGFVEYEARPGALGQPLPGCDVAVLRSDGTAAGPREVGEICVRRRSGWFRAKDLGFVDDDGYFHYQGRADDVIISSGWTISPLEVERTLLRHPSVLEAAVIGVPDDVRGHIVKAFVVTELADDRLERELQDLVRSQLSPHEYPRAIERVDVLPKTHNGKIDRRALRAPTLAQNDPTPRRASDNSGS